MVKAKESKLLKDNDSKKLQSEHFPKQFDSDKLDIKNNPASVYDDATSLNANDDNKTNRSANKSAFGIKIIDNQKKDETITPKGPKPLSQILSKEQLFKLKFHDEDATDLFDNEKDKNNVLATMMGCFMNPS